MYLNVFVGFCLLLTVCQRCISHSINEKQYREIFENFKKTYNKAYASSYEHELRFSIFVENIKRAEILQENDQGTAEYGVTKFSDLSAAEFKRLYLGLNLKVRTNTVLPNADIPDVSIPKNFDWRKKNKISEVKDQGKCGSCWAFSTTGNIEGLWAIQKNELLSLSEQELLDCDTLDSGCNGGLMTTAYEAIMTLGGLESEAAYPYEASQGTCQLNTKKIVATIRGGVNITSDEKKMVQWLYKNGPISIGINADNMQLYKKGIAHPSKSECDPYDLDHGVLIVGYGKQRKIPYWIIKNSWDTSWGEQGYYRVYRGGGVCGLNTAASSAALRC